MNGQYAYTQQIWPSVLTVLLLITLSIYSWRRRSVPGALPLAISCLLVVPLTISLLMGSVAVDAETRLFWAKIDDIWWLPGTTAITCFILEYAWPGRWLTRRNLFLLSIVPLLSILLIPIRDFYSDVLPYSILRGIGADAFGPVGGILFLYSFILFFINMVVFGWLFIRAPQYRLPVILMAAGQIIVRILLLMKSAELEAQLWQVPVFAFPYLAYSIALFGFRMFDPIPLARQMSIEQLHAGMLVLDPQERLKSMNTAAEEYLEVPMKQAMGRPVRELLPAYPERAEAAPDEAEIEFSLGTGQHTRYYTLALSMLRDFRGLEVGRLLLLRDVTRQKHDQAQIMEQQRVLAIQDERERMARELHDSLGQVLSYTSFQVETAAKLSRAGQGADAAVQLDRLGIVVRAAHADLREHILNLHTTASLQQPFSTSVEQYLDSFTSSYDIQTHLTVDPVLGNHPFPSDTQLQVFRILQEALSNARKHGHAHQVQVTFTTVDGRVFMTIQDDGCGFAPDKVFMAGGPHYGLQFMRERARQLEGSLQVQSSPGAGTRVVLSIPKKE